MRIMFDLFIKVDLLNLTATENCFIQNGSSVPYVFAKTLVLCSVAIFQSLDLSYSIIQLITQAKEHGSYGQFSKLLKTENREYGRDSNNAKRHKKLWRGFFFLTITLNSHISVYYYMGFRTIDCNRSVPFFMSTKARHRRFLIFFKIKT